ncbi:MAG: lipopolysaccharide transport periplasmic protein LptA [Betaproteobacteria bacterium]
MTRLSPSILTTALLALVIGAAHAEKADRLKPLNAEADAMRHDELKQQTLFTGNVIINKGTMVLRGERIEVTQTSDGYQRATIQAAPGKLALWRSKRDGVDEYVEAEAELIEYDGRADTLQMSRQAVLRRYVGSKVADETVGAVIRYDNAREVFTVDGEPRGVGSSASGTGGSGGRVRAQLSPRAAPPAAGAAPPPSPAPLPAPTLRPSPALGNQR